MYELKLYIGVMCHDNDKWCEIWKGLDLSIQNWYEEFDEFWPKHSKFLKIWTLMSFFWLKYIMFELKKYRGVIFDCTEDWCKIWRKTDLYFLKWHEEFCKFLFTSWKIDFILERKMAELNKNKQKFKTTISTKCSVKTLFYFGNKWIA